MPTISMPVIEQISLTRVVSALIVLLIASLVIRYIAHLLSVLAERSPRARFLVKWIEPITRIGIWSIALFSCAALISPTKDTFLAAIGSIALAIGLGAQDLIKNLLGGLIILTDRPYQLGDRVRIGDAYGEIDHIGLRSTKLTTPDNVRVTIPNADILDSHVFNSSGGGPHCQVVTDLFLPIHADLEEAIRIGYEAAYASPFFLPTHPVSILLADQFSEVPFMRLRIKAFVHDHRLELEMQTDITVRAKREFARRGLLNSWSEAISN